LRRGDLPIFACQPAAPGILRLLVMQRTGIWKMEMPIRVKP
jgi:hypothetical protein